MDYHANRKGKYLHPNSIERLNFDYKYLIQPLGTANSSTIKISAEVPIGQRVVYIPGVLETLKFAWVQYLALLIPCLWVFYIVNGFVFRYQIVETSVSSDLVASKRF